VTPHRFVGGAVAVGTALLLSATLAAQLSSQWDYKDPAIPRLPDGKANLAAPAPRMPDGKPDLSGYWNPAGGMGQNLRYIHNVTEDLKDDEVLPWAEALSQQRVRDQRKDAPLTDCLPMGIPWHASFNSMRMVQTPKLIVLTYQANNNNPSRTIYLDGRDLPKDPEPTWLGYSVGRWEGDTLVVTTIGFNDRTWLDTAGHPQTESLRMTERMRRRDFGHMDFEYTVEDPKAFKRPITIKIDRQLAPDEDLREDVCVELNKSAGHLVGGSSFVPKKATLATYAGIYALPSGEEVTVTVKGGDLVYVRGPGEFFESKMPLFPIADGQFMSSGPGAFSATPNIYEFGKDAKGNVAKLTLKTAKGEKTATRKTASGAATPR